MDHSEFALGIVVLGCDKNTVDAEHFAGAVARNLPGGGRILALGDPEAVLPPLDAVVIFTCAFIHDAKTESIAAILAWGQRKVEEGNPRRLYVAGCLSQRYAADLKRELPEVDAFVGVNQLDALILELRRSRSEGERAAPTAADGPMRRRLEDAPHAFLKIADGCNHACSFCIIPAIKGPYYSMPREMLLAEARALIDSGARELCLVAQDTAAYGRDLYDHYGLPELLRDLCALDGDFWVRCLYCYPSGVTDALLHEIASQPKIAPYLDIPLQHTAPRMLRAMGRPAANLDLPAFVARLRAAVPGLVLRTTMMVGFPGEGPSDHRHMLETMAALRFEWLGAFIFCPEEGAPAAALPKQVGKRTARARYDAVMETQAEITASFNEERQGRQTRVLVERFDEVRGLWQARSVAEAPEVDGAIFLKPHPKLRPGRFCMATLTQADLYDCLAEPVL